MVSKVQIKKDKYSIYFKIGEGVYRPIQTPETLELFGHILPDITLSRFKEGTYVIVKELSNGIATAKSENYKIKEKWFLHGKGRSPSQWNPGI